MIFRRIRLFVTWKSDETHHRSTKTEFPARIPQPNGQCCFRKSNTIVSASYNDTWLCRIKSIRPDLVCCALDQSFIRSKTSCSWWMTISGPDGKKGDECKRWQDKFSNLQERFSDENQSLLSLFPQLCVHSNLIRSFPNRSRQVNWNHNHLSLP